jgi:hypothetical protein
MDRFGFVDQHNGDIFSDFIKQFTFIADQAVAFFSQADFALAFGTGQDFQQLFADGHGVAPFNSYLD